MKIVFCPPLSRAGSEPSIFIRHGRNRADLGRPIKSAVEGTGYFDVWTAFALNRATQRPKIGKHRYWRSRGPMRSCSSYQIKTEVADRADVRRH
jgi:hypothetical protein